MFLKCILVQKFVFLKYKTEYVLKLLTYLFFTSLKFCNLSPFPPKPPLQNPYDISCVQSNTGTSFSPSTAVCVCQNHGTNTTYSYCIRLTSTLHSLGTSVILAIFFLRSANLGFNIYLYIYRVRLQKMTDTWAEVYITLPDTHLDKVICQRMSVMVSSPLVPTLI